MTTLARRAAYLPATPALTFPKIPLVVKIEFAFGADLTADPASWTYYDVTRDWQPDRDLAAKIGRADGTSKPQPASLNLWLKNTGGVYTKGNPTSPWWPYIRKNTPIRVTLDPGTGHIRQYGMYVSQWIPRWGTDGRSGRQPLVQVVANGVRRRLTQGNTPLRSALYRAITGNATKPVAFWSLEDQSNATQGADVYGGAAMLPTGTVSFGSVDGPVSTDRLAGVSGGMLVAPVSYPASSEWAIAFWFQIPTSATSATLTRITSSGGTWTLSINYDGSLSLTLTVNGTTTTTTTTLSGTAIVFDGKWHECRITANLTPPKFGVGVDFDLHIDGALIGGNTASGAVFSNVTRVQLGDLTDNITSIGMAALYNTASIPGFYGAKQANVAYTGETAVERLTRLCGEEGVPLTVVGTSDVLMGPQKPGAFVDLLDSCQDADGGILLDGLGPGWAYITRSQAYNLPVAMTVDMAGRQFRAPFEPMDDDTALINDETLNRDGGSFARYIATDADSPDVIGLYDNETTLNLEQDTDLIHHAAWRVHLGTATADVLRFPGIGFDLHTAAGSALIEPWLQGGVRTRVQVVNPPAEYGPGPIDLLIEGYSETVSSRRVWSVAANTSPYDPWRVFVLDTDRLDADASSVLAADISATATTLQVQSSGAPGAAWTTDPAEWTSPQTLYIDVGGEQMQVTNITGASSPQTFTVVRSVNGVIKAPKAGTHVGLWQPRVLAL